MFRSNDSRHASERASEYATCENFQQIFDEDMAALHQLAYLLTADTALAEQCFLAALDDSIHGNPVFKQWARAWSKRAIIQNAIKTVAPAPGNEDSRNISDGGLRKKDPGKNSLAGAVIAWPAFDRFVFVMSVLEGYSLRECSTLLSCKVQDVIESKSAVLQRLADEPAGVAAASALAGIPWDTLRTRAQVA
ncbi:MAG TPA: hypothetical protein VFT65_11610 [Candidatus Angelobacter sp.]|nr:hypothetical protein [Candidatus Angelobacter sp.]